MEIFIDKEFDIQVFTKWDTIAEFKEKWKELYENCNSTNLYSDPNFFISQFNFRSPNYEPYLIYFEKDAKPLGIVLGKTVTKKISAKIGYFKFNSNYLNTLEIEIDSVIISHPLNADHITLFLKNLLKEKLFDVIEFQHFSENNIMWNTLINKGVADKKIAFNGKEHLIKIRDEKTGDIVINNSSKTIRNLKRYDRAFTNYFDSFELKIYYSIEDVGKFLIDSETIAKKSYHHDLGVGIKNNLEWQKKIKSLINENYFLGFILYGNNIPIAYNFGVVHNKYLFGFNTSFDLSLRKIMPGGFLFRRIIEYLQENMFLYYHLGYGDAEYKRQYGSLCFDEATFIYFGSSFKSYCAYYFVKSFDYVNNKLISALKNLGILNRIKKLWRSTISK